MNKTTLDKYYEEKQTFLSKLNERLEDYIQYDEKEEEKKNNDVKLLEVTKSKVMYDINNLQISIDERKSENNLSQLLKKQICITSYIMDNPHKNELFINYISSSKNKFKKNNLNGQFHPMLLEAFDIPHVVIDNYTYGIPPPHITNPFIIEKEKFMKEEQNNIVDESEEINETLYNNVDDNEYTSYQPHINNITELTEEEQFNSLFAKTSVNEIIYQCVLKNITNPICFTQINNTHAKYLPRLQKILEDALNEIGIDLFLIHDTLLSEKSLLFTFPVYDLPFTIDFKKHSQHVKVLNIDVYIINDYLITLLSKIVEKHNTELTILTCLTPKNNYTEVFKYFGV